MAESQAPAAPQAPQQESSPQAPDQSPADLSADFGDITPDSGGPSGDDISDALEAVGYTPGHHNLEGADSSEGEGETRKPADSSPAEKSAQTEASPSPAESDTVKPAALASFHRAQREFEAKRQAFAAENAEILKTKALIDNAAVDPIAALEAIGHKDVKSFLERLAEDGGRMTPERRELLELKKWREAQETQARTQQEQFQAQQHQAQIQSKLDQIKVNVQNRLKSPEYAESVLSLQDSDHQVMLEMDAMANESGTMPDIDKAIGRVQSRFETVMKELVSTPASRKYLENLLGQSKSGQTVAAQSKQRENPRTIGQDARSPGTHIPSENRSSRGDDVDLEDATKWLRQVTRR